MKRPRPPEGPEGAAPGPSPSRRKLSNGPTPATELQHEKPCKKVIGLRGKALLRTKLKEQKIRITQKQAAIGRLRGQVDTFKEKETDFLHVLASVDRHWTQLESRLMALLSQYPSASLPEPPPLQPPEKGKKATNPVDLVLREVTAKALPETIAPETLTQLSETLDPTTAEPAPEKKGKKKKGKEESEAKSDGPFWTEECEKSVRRRVEWTGTLLNLLLAEFKKQADGNQALFTMLKSKATPELLKTAKVHHKEQERLKIKLAKFSKEVTALRAVGKVYQELYAEASQKGNWLEEENLDIVQRYNHLLRNYIYIRENYDRQEKSMAERKKKIGKKNKTKKKKKQQTDAKPAAEPPAEPAPQKDLTDQVTARILDNRMNEILKLRKQLLSKEKNAITLKREKSELKSQVDAFVALCYSRDTESVELNQAREVQSLTLVKTRQHTKEQLERVRREKEELRRKLEKSKEALYRELQQVKLEKDKIQLELEKKADYPKQRELVRLFETKNNELTKQVQKLRENEASARKLKEENEKLKEKVEALQLEAVDRLIDDSNTQSTQTNVQKYIDAIKRLKSEVKSLRGARDGRGKDGNSKKTIQLLSEQVERSVKAVSEIEIRHEQREQKLNVQIKGLTDKNNALVNQSATWNVRLRRTGEEKCQLLAKLAKQNEIIKQQNTLLQAQKHSQRNSLNKLSQMGHGYNLSQSNCETWKRESEQAVQRINQLNVKVKEKDNLLAECTREIQIKTEDLARVKSEYRRLEEKYVRAKGKKGKKDGGKKNYNVEVLETQIDILNAKLKCTLCNTREKKVVLECCHVFCEQCIQSLIKSRNRKCPKCMKNFNRNETRTIFH